MGFGLPFPVSHARRPTAARPPSRSPAASRPSAIPAASPRPTGDDLGRPPARQVRRGFRDHIPERHRTRHPVHAGGRPYYRLAASPLAQPAALARSRLTSFAGRASLCRALARFAREDAVRSSGGLTSVGRPPLAPPGSRVASLPARHHRGASLRSAPRSSRVVGRSAQLAARSTRRQSGALPSPRSLRSRGHRSPIRGAPLLTAPAGRRSHIRRHSLRSCRPGRASRLPLARSEVVLRSASRRRGGH